MGSHVGSVYQRCAYIIREAKTRPRSVGSRSVCFFFDRKNVYKSFWCRYESLMQPTLEFGQTQINYTSFQFWICTSWAGVAQHSNPLSHELSFQLDKSWCLQNILYKSDMFSPRCEQNNQRRKSNLEPQVAMFFNKIIIHK